MPSAIIIAWLSLAAFGAGVVDAIAGGGGLITVPALLAAGFPPQVALATNKGQAVFGALTSFTSFWRKDGIDRARAPRTFVAAFGGSLAGALALLAMRPDALRPLVIALLVMAALVVLSPRRTTARNTELRYPTVVLIAIAFSLGAYDGFFGPGTGSLLIVAFVFFFGDTLTRASGNAKVANLASNIAAFLIFAAHHAIVWRVALPMAVANVTGAALGARLVFARGERIVRWVVLAVVTAAIARVSYDLHAR